MFRNGAPIIVAGVLAIGAILGPRVVAAAEEKDIFDSIPGSFNGSVALATDYVYRGASQTDEHPALQGSIGWSNELDLAGQKSTLALGIWGSNVDFNDGDRASVELDYTAGLSTEVAGVGVAVGYIYYSYPGSGSAANYNFHEGNFYLSKDFGLAKAKAGINWSPNFFGDTGDAYYWDFGVDVPLPAKFTASGHVALQNFDRAGLDDYVDWFVRIARPVKGIDLSLTYYDTDVEDGGFCGATNDNCSTRFVFAVSKAF